MKCPNCKFELPDDSDFCSYCGIMFATIDTKKSSPPPEKEEVRPPEHPHSTKKHDKAHEQQAASQHGGDLNYDYGEPDYGYNLPSYAQPAAQKAPKAPKAQKEVKIGSSSYPAPGVRVFAVICSLLVISALANLIQYNKYRNLDNSMISNNNSLHSSLSEKDKAISEKDQTIADQEQMIEQKDSTIAEQEKTITEQETKIEDLNNQVVILAEKAEDYDKMYNTLASGTDKMGYSSGNFYSSESVIVLHKSQKNRKFTLTAEFNNDVGVGVRYNPSDNPSATVKFSGTRFAKTTEVTVVPHEKGITTVTFFNDGNAQTFDIVIMVTD